MTTITIPKELSRKGELVVIPLREYEKFLTWQRTIKSIRIFKPSLSGKKAIELGRKAIKKGDYVTLEELKKELNL